VGLGLGFDEAGENFGVGVAGKGGAGGGEGGFEGDIVLDDTVMDDGDVARLMRVSVELGGGAVGGPAGVADAGVTGERAGVEGGGEVGNLA